MPLVKAPGIMKGKNKHIIRTSTASITEGAKQHIMIMITDSSAIDDVVALNTE
jgi:hypothetical protein